MYVHVRPAKINKKLYSGMISMMSCQEIQLFCCYKDPLRERALAYGLFIL